MEQFSCVVNTRPKCFAFFPPNSVVALHLLCAFQPEMCLRTWEGSVRFSCNLYSRFFQCKILIYVHPQKTTIPALFWTVLVSVDQEFL